MSLICVFSEIISVNTYYYFTQLESKGFFSLLKIVGRTGRFSFGIRKYIFITAELWIITGQDDLRIVIYPAIELRFGN